MATQPLNHKSAGFTLIEVLIALAVLAIALTAIIKATTSNISNTEKIANKTISEWIAVDIINQIQLGTLPANNQTDQKIKTLKKNWYWSTHISNSPISSVKRIDVSISQSAGATPVTTLEGYLNLNKSVQYG